MSKPSTQRSVKWAKQHPAKKLWHSARDRAKRKGQEFTITQEDIIVPILCPICKVRLAAGTIKDRTTSPSLDRIDNLVGYTRKNIWVICNRCNTIKGESSIEDLLRIAAAVEARLHANQ